MSKEFTRAEWKAYGTIERAAKTRLDGSHLDIALRHLNSFMEVVQAGKAGDW